MALVGDPKVSSANGQAPRKMPNGALAQPQAPGALVRERDGQAAREWLFPSADELFRGIYTRAGVGLASEVLGISSAIAGEGKTTLSVGIAVTVAQDFPDRHVLLVETDYRRPALAEDFSVEPDPGLVDCILTDRSIQDAFRPTHLANLDLLPAGGLTTRPGRALRASRLATLIERLREAYDLIILDMPALLVNSDAFVLGELADSVILVVRNGVTPSNMVSKAIDELDETKLRGVVLNGAQSAIPGWLRRVVGT